MVESQPSKLLVAGSIPVSRSILRSHRFLASFGWQAISSRKSRESFGWQGNSSTDWLAEAFEGVQADLSAEAPKARRPM